jgi:hypothetical protein
MIKKLAMKYGFLLYIIHSNYSHFGYANSGSMVGRFLLQQATSCSAVSLVHGLFLILLKKAMC